jgi:hypothetical protein
MAARSRPRGGHTKDEFDEERALWNQIRADARRIDQLMVSIAYFVKLPNTHSTIACICRYGYAWELRLRQSVSGHSEGACDLGRLHQQDILLLELENRDETQMGQHQRADNSC